MPNGNVVTIFARAAFATGDGAFAPMWVWVALPATVT
jgi:hypothetical protein